MKIFKPYEKEKPEVRCNCCGNIMEPEYKERYDENGHPYLEKVGEVNTYEKIQSYRDQCDVMAILSRYAAGDESALATPGYYIDTTKLPKTYTEYLNMMNEQREKFDMLPTLSSTWIKEGTENIDRTLAVQSSNSHQFICNFFYEQAWTRPMPIYSVPGIDTI